LFSPGRLAIGSETSRISPRELEAGADQTVRI
jgi:hypothetical protein